ncbi:UDP-glucose flavonoid 3-O-glucosyltransferase 7-like [Argentina anserina]|uniref:UDP-glucose flavonoid 3-O-glucosyltransferase 7-like n=1 Tax=Argentina anserina TaxID=57926 RepID=UPI0021763104|nr:UDP-glucose flavonoid 3-O-glucosyltransferase 7-like [Potentilla anserina]
MAEEDKKAEIRYGHPSSPTCHFSGNSRGSALRTRCPTSSNQRISAPPPFEDTELLEIALGLEASGQDFIWVLKNEKKDVEEWLPEGFEKRMEGKGMIIRDWAPQVLILEHEAIVAFVTHCEWNSILEEVSAGVPMITWPLFGEQFYNEKLVPEILRIGIPVGSAKRVSSFLDVNVEKEASVRRDAIEEAVTRIMVGHEVVNMRRRVEKLGEKAMRAVEDGGASYSDLTSLVEELKHLVDA